MTIKRISGVVFSPTDSTKNVLDIMKTMFPFPVETTDITRFDQDEKSYSFNEDELVIFAVPVYGGRVPVPAALRIRNIRGNNTPAIIVAVYGNRDYDDALLELKTIVEDKGFVAIAAAAFIAEHSIMHSVAAGRPDKDDKILIQEFANNVWEKVKACESVADFPAITVKGNKPYRDYSGLPFKPKASKACSKCGVCAANCPAGAIPKGSPSITNTDYCISCMRCIKICPIKARSLSQLPLMLAEKVFYKKNSERKQPEIILN